MLQSTDDAGWSCFQSRLTVPTMEGRQIRSERWESYQNQSRLSSLVSPSHLQMHRLTTSRPLPLRKTAAAKIWNSVLDEDTIFRLLDLSFENDQTRTLEPTWLQQILQSHHHNGDDAARRPHICFHPFGALAKAVGLLITSLHTQPMYPKMCSIDIFANLY